MQVAILVPVHPVLASTKAMSTSGMSLAERMNVSIPGGRAARNKTGASTRSKPYVRCQYSLGSKTPSLLVSLVSLQMFTFSFTSIRREQAHAPLPGSATARPNAI